MCRAAQANRLVADADVLAALGALVEAYRTLASGIYYEKPPDYRVQREVYDAVRTTVEEFKKADAQTRGMSGLRDSEIRDALTFLAQLGATRANGRPKGRAFLDFLRTQFKSEELSKPASNIVLLP
jgi:hypothetical protein